MCVCRARVGGAGDRRILAASTQAHAAGTDNRLTAIVDAYEQATGAALDEIVANTARTVDGNLEHR